MLPGVGAAPTRSSSLMRQLERERRAFFAKDKTVLPRNYDLSMVFFGGFTIFTKNLC